MTIGRFLEDAQQNVVMCRPEDTVEAVATLLTTNRIGAMPVRNAEGAMVGIVSERDLVRAFSQAGCKMAALRASDIMTRDVITCRRDDTMDEARKLMSRHGFRHLPVVEKGEIFGILSIRDTLQQSLEKTALEVNVLRDSVIAARYR